MAIVLTCVRVLMSHTRSVLDLSFNNLKHIPKTLDKLTSLRTIYFVQNRIAHISGLEGVGRTLRSLELGGNRLRVISFPVIIVFR